jgi:hypothetical protein
LKAHGIGKGKKVTAYPCFQEEMETGGDYFYVPVNKLAIPLDFENYFNVLYKYVSVTVRIICS